MKHLLLSVLLLFSWNAYSQENSLLERLCQNVSESCLSLDYSYTARISGIDNHAGGTLVNQGEKWIVKGNGIEMYCDGSCVWVIDPALKEVVIEPIGSQDQQSFLTNPARAFVSVSDSFHQDAVNTSADGKALIYSLSPKMAEGIQYLNIEIEKATAVIRSMSFALEDGTLVKIKVSSMKLTPEVSVEAFSPRNVFDSSWIVSDLR